MKKLLLLFLIPIILGGIWLAIPPEIPHDPQWVFYDRQGEVLFSDDPYFSDQSGIPETLIQTLITLEDKDFYHHIGVDFSALIRATYQNIYAQEIVSGASTIPMQLARILFLQDQPRTLSYKIKQIVLALKLDAHLSKEEILDLYLKKVNLGQGAIGFKAAAKRYFDAPLSSLSQDQIALLVGIIPRPYTWNPIADKTYAQKRRDHVLKILKVHHKISQEKYTFYTQRPVSISPTEPRALYAPHFVFWTRQQLQEKIPPNTQEVHVHTTLDKAIYQKVRAFVEDQIHARKHDRHVSNASLVALNTKNEIIVMLGSQDFFDDTIQGKINMTTASRELGSTLKPFLFALALQKGFSPLDQLRDERQSFQENLGAYTPRNFDPQKEFGRVRFREALTNSYNIASVDLLDKIGVETFHSFLKKTGLSIRQNAQKTGLALILGSGESSLFELTHAYTIFQHNGDQKDTRFFSRIQNEKGETILVPSPQSTHNILNAQSAEWIRHALSDTQARWKTFGRGNPLELPFEVAAKTGTSQDFRDNYVVGLSTDYTVGTWVGNADGTPMHTSSGMEGAGPIWQGVMHILHTEAPQDFTYTSQRRETPVCRRPYKIWPNCAETFTAFLLPEEIPTQDRNTPPLKTKEPTLQISFPGDGDIFHPDSKLLIQTRYSQGQDVQYFFDDIPTDPIIPNLSPGTHTIRIESGNESDEIDIFVEE